MGIDETENLPKERRRQEALGQLEDEVAGMSDEAGPPGQEIVEVVEDDAEQQPHLVGPEAMTGEASSEWRSCLP